MNYIKHKISYFKYAFTFQSKKKKEAFTHFTFANIAVLVNIELLFHIHVKKPLMTLTTTFYIEESIKPNE